MDTMGHDGSVNPPSPQFDSPHTAEHARLAEAPGQDDPWRHWGPYVAGRQWGTVREDYSADGNAWDAFGFEQASARAYRWGEDGIAGLCDRYGFLNLAVALWNGRDERLKERLFGLTNAQGNHGEDVKEYWWALDATPTHSYARMLYRYPLRAFPYADLLERNAAAGLAADEYELADTGVLAGDAFADVVVTHAKAAENDVLMTIEVTNRWSQAADVHVLPQMWFRNTWAWGRDDRTPHLSVEQRGGPAGDPPAGQPGEQPSLCGEPLLLATRHDFLGRMWLGAQSGGVPLVCDNETNAVLLFGADTNRSPHPGRDRAGRRARRRERSGRWRAWHEGRTALHLVPETRHNRNDPPPTGRRPGQGDRPRRVFREDRGAARG